MKSQEVKRDKSIIVLGASVGQLPLINLCKQMGYYVIAVSPKGRYVGLSVADEVLYENIRNKETILNFAREWNVVGIVSDQLDMAVPIVAFLSEKLHLRGIKPEIAEIYTNKAKMRILAQRAGVKIPNFIEAYTLLDALMKLSEQTQMTFPLMLKPIDSAASHGIHLLKTLQDLESYFEDAKKWSKTGFVIIEQYIDGQEYVVESYTHNFEPVVLAIGKRDYFNVEGAFIPRATVFKDSLSANQEIEKKLKQANVEFIKCSGLEFGITHGEFICEKKSGDIYLVEIAARGGGVQTSSDIIPAACGINVEELLIKDILGLYDDKPINIRPGAAGYFCYILPEGEIVEVRGCSDVEKITGVKAAFWNNVAVGDKVGPICDKASRKGPIVVEGSSVEECYSIADKVKSMLSIKVKTTFGTKDAIWE